MSTIEGNIEWLSIQEHTDRYGKEIKLRIGIDHSAKTKTFISPFKEVSKEVFAEFIHNYPRRLKLDVNGIPQPPVLSYYDRAIGEEVAYVQLKNFLSEGDKLDENNSFYILK